MLNLELLTTGWEHINMGLFGRWKTIISNGSGGSVPSNVVLFEDWTGGESVTIDTNTSPTDTTPPIVTISPNGGTFSIPATTSELEILIPF